MTQNRIDSARRFRRSSLFLAFVAALPCLALPAHANEECGAASPGGQVVCEPDGNGAVPSLNYTGVSDFELRLREGFVVDGNLLPEGDTAVVLYGEGDVSLFAEDGTIIQAHYAWPAIDVVSGSGAVDVRVDQVFGGSVGVAALAAGDVSIWANYVDGVVAIDAYSQGGNVLVDVADVQAWGMLASGVTAVTERGDVTILAGASIVEGDFSTGLQAVSLDGSVAIEAGFIRAEGLGSLAVLAQSWDGGDVMVDVGTAVALGEGSAGVVAAAGFGDVGVRAGWIGASGSYGLGLGVFAFEGSAFVDVENMGTDGDFTRGMDIGARYDVHVNNGSVFTSGYGADAINIETTGIVSVQSGRLTTYGDESTGLRVLTGGDILVNIDEIETYGVRSSAMQLSTDTGDITARVGNVYSRATSGDWYGIGISSSFGMARLLVDGAVRVDSGYAITAGSWFGQAHVRVNAGASVYGETTAIDAATALGTRIDIAGTVSSGRGPVIQIRGTDEGDGAADIRLASTGQLHGWLDLSGGDDVVSNAGEFITSGTSQFGAGQDQFLNTGRVRLTDYANFAHLQGLERFENAGLLTLANGSAGDVFAIDGTLHGAQGGRLVVDLEVDGFATDRIVVGALSGRNELSLAFVGSGSLLGLDGVQVLSSGASQNGDELVLAAGSRNRGFIGLELDYDGFGNWRLESDLADAAYLAGAVPAGARELWRQGAQAVTSHLDATGAQADAHGAWLQVLGGDFDGKSEFSHAQGRRNLDWQGSHQGVQAGWETTLGNWRAGVTAGMGEADMDLGGAEQTRLDSVNAGIYARYRKDGWFAGAQLRGERFDLDSDWASIGLEDSGSGSAIGLQLEGGRRFEVAAVWIEPSLRLSWVDLSLPALDGAGGEVHWQAGTGGAGELGLSVGLSEGWRGLRPYASMSISREFGGGDATRYDTGFDDVVVDQAGGRSFGRFAAGLQWNIGPAALYGEVDARTGDIEGSTARLGVRVNF